MRLLLPRLRRTGAGYRSRSFPALILKALLIVQVLFVATDEVAFRFIDEVIPGHVVMFPTVGSVSSCVLCRFDVP